MSQEIKSKKIGNRLMKTGLCVALGGLLLLLLIDPTGRFAWVPVLIGFVIFVAGLFVFVRSSPRNK